MIDRVDIDAAPRRAGRVPGAALSQWVAVIWYSSDDRGGITRERLMPRGTFELVIELGSEPAAIITIDRRIDVDPVSVVGASPRSFLLERPNRFETIGVTFRPGGAFALLGIPVDELDGAPLALGLLWGGRAAELRERAGSATGPHEKLAAVERVLTQQLAYTERARRYHPAIAAMARIAAAPERCRIADLSISVGISRRRLEETFRVVAGSTPKRFQRLWRFRRALERIDQRTDSGWAAFALGVGYYDQAHFSNEFRHHAGLSPEGYLAARTPAPNHVRIDALRPEHRTEGGHHGDQAHPSLRRER